MRNLMRPPKVVAVSSGGGHWEELRRLRPAWEGAQVTYVVTGRAYMADISKEAKTQSVGFFTIVDANAKNKFRLLGQALKMFGILVWLRPDVVISTGAAPGYFAIRFGKLLGARTIWVDSVANAEEISKAGNLARKHCDLWLTQWPHLADKVGADYAGAVM